MLDGRMQLDEHPPKSVSIGADPIVIGAVRLHFQKRDSTSNPQTPSVGPTSVLLFFRPAIAAATLKDQLEHPATAGLSSLMPWSPTMLFGMALAAIAAMTATAVPATTPSSPRMRLLFCRATRTATYTHTAARMPPAIRVLVLRRHYCSFLLSSVSVFPHLISTSAKLVDACDPIEREW